MKLSKIINQEKIRSLTVNIHSHYVVTESFYFGSSKAKLKVYKNIEIDVDLNEANLQNVKHLGVKRYRTINIERFYANIYNY